MSIEVTINNTNTITSTPDFEGVIAKRNGEGEFAPRTYTVFSIPKTLLDEVREMVEQYGEELDCEFDSDGELEQYHEDETIDKLLRHLVYAEGCPKTFSITVEFTVEAMNGDEATTKLTDELGWGLDYNVTSVYED